MAEDADSLEAYLATQRSNNAPCWCETAPAEIIVQIDKQLVAFDAAITAAEKAGRKPPSLPWTAITRWLSKQLDDRPLGKNALQRHQDEGHHAG